MLAERHACKQGAGIRTPSRQQRNDQMKRAVLRHREHANQAHEQIRNENAAEIGTGKLLKSKLCVMPQQQNKQHHDADIQHRAHPIHRIAVSRAGKRHAQSEQHRCNLQLLVVFSCGRCGKFLRRTDGQCHHEQLRDDRREDEQRKDDNNCTGHAKCNSCFHGLYSSESSISSVKFINGGIHIRRLEVRPQDIRKIVFCIRALPQQEI